MKLEFSVELPEKYLKDFLQAMRDFEMRDAEAIVMKMTFDAPEMDAKKAREIFASIRPPYKYIEQRKRLK